MSSDLELSIVMPCLNEAETLETCIVKARTWLEDNNVRGEIVIGDNGSTDGSQDIARRCGARVVDVPIRGYGAALFHATKEARGKYVIMGDSDDSYDFSHLELFVEKLREGFDLVMGNRFKGGIQPGAMPFKNRYLGNPVLSLVGRVFFKTPIADFHCGLRGFSKTGFEKMDLRTTGMEYASEMVVNSTLKGLKIAEVPTTLSPDGRTHAPHLRPWRDGWRHLRFMLLYCPRWLFYYPGLALMAVGLAVGAWLIPAPRQVGPMLLDIHTLLFAAAFVLIGFQAVLFYVFTKVYAIRNGLLPTDERFDRWMESASLEVTLIAGIFLILLGLAGALSAVYLWAQQSFGPMSPPQLMRWTIPSVLSCILGTQTILASFFVGVLNLPTRK